MTDQEIEEAIRDNIDLTYHMSLATCANEFPWVCEVHFVYDEQLNLYFRSKESRRHSQEIVENPHVAGNIVDTYSLDESPVGLYFEGIAQKLEDEEIEEIFPLFEDRMGLGEEIIEDARRTDGHKFYKVTVKNWHVFGKFHNEQAGKYSLKWGK